MASPGNRLETHIVPLRLHCSPVPRVSAIVEQIDQSGVIAVSKTLHDVHVVAGEQHLGGTPGKMLVRRDQQKTLG